MANKILVFLEQRNGQIKKASFEAAKVGADMASSLNGEVEAVVIGNEVAETESVGNYGISKVTHLKNSELGFYSPSAYKELLNNFISENGFDIFLTANTSLGKDLAPRVSVGLDTSPVMDCVAFNYENGLTATRPVYAGKALLDIKVTSDNKVFTIRPNVFSPGEPGSDSANVTVTETSPSNFGTKVIEEKKAGDKLDVAEADIIVSGGRGWKAAENFSTVEELAGLLGAAVGASRAVVDAGWRPHAEQVGQTGKTVSPNLYFALAISGAIQHLAGMRSSKFIVAVNKDKDAPIFQVADYGIIGDVFEVVPAMIEEIKKAG